MSDTLAPLVWTGAAILVLALVWMRLQAARRRRPASTLPAFLRHFEARDVPVELAAAAFHQLQRWMQAQDRHFAVRPDQDLRKVYGIVPEELDAALVRLAAECDRRFDPRVPHPPIVRVEDLVLALARCPEEPA